jgi:PAS domain S-box-containing protein
LEVFDLDYGKREFDGISTDCIKFINSLSDYILILNHSNEILFINYELLIRSEFNEDELVGKNISILFPSDRNLDINNTLKKIEENKIGGYVNLITKSGNVTFAELEYYENLWNSSNLNILICKELSRFDQILNKKHNKLIKGQSEYAEMLLDTIPTAVTVFDKNEKIIMWNDMAKKLTGFSEKEVIGKKYTDFSRLLCIENCNISNINGDAISSVCAIKNKNGEVRYISKNIGCLKNEFNIEMGTIECFYDVTDKFISENKLKESEERYSAIVNSSPETVIIHRLGRIIFVNKTGSDISGYSQEEIIGSMVTDYLTKESKKIVIEALKIREKGFGVTDYEVEFIKKNGDKINFIVKTSQITYENVPATLVLLSDITKRKAIERNLLRAKNQAEEANILKSQFLANMSHEIRTPMNGITGYMQLLSETNLTIEQEEYLRETKNASEILLNILNDILDYSKIEANKLDIEKIPFNLHSLIEDSIMLLSPKAFEKNIEIYPLIYSDVPETVVGDPGRLRQVLNNLISNAVKFTENGEITVSVRGGEEISNYIKVDFSVIDSGIGISKNNIRKLFQVFTQADSSTTRKYGGTGLGLAISQKLVEIMGGEIFVNSEINKGSKFSFYINFEKANNSNYNKLIKKESLKNIKIALLDDKKSSRLILKNYLESDNCEIIEIECSENAINSLKSVFVVNEKIDLAIIDYMIPNEKIINLAKEIKRNDKFKDMRLIMITSTAKKGDAKVSREAGFDGFLTKPLRKSELLDVIHLVLNDNFEGKKNKLITKYSVMESKRDKKIKILVVEDTEANRKLIVRFINKQGLKCDFAINGKEAILACEKKKYDLIFMDCQMPEIDGYVATEKIRESSKLNKDTYIVALTANALQGDMQKCLNSGMNYYLPKPINFKKLKELIEKFEN